MTQDEIMQLAKDAGLRINVRGTYFFVGFGELSDLLDAATAKEREACAEIAEKQRYSMHISLTSHPAQNGTAVGIANEIRARGEA